MATITGTSGNDRDDNSLSGTVNSDRYRGLAGDDWFFVGTGNDTIEGGSGFDVVIYEWDAFDWVKINLTNTQRYGLAAQTVLKSNGQIDSLSSIEAIHGTQGNDLILLSGGGYTFDGEGDDVIYIYDNSSVFLGGGNDRIIGSGSAWINMDNGWDPYAMNGVTIMFNRQGTGKIFDTVAGTMDSFRGIYGINGTYLNDHVFGGSGNDVAEGLAGNDFLSGAGGDDTLSGGDGDDTLEGGSGDNVLRGGEGDDTYIFGYDGMTRIVDNAGSNVIIVEKSGDAYYKELVLEGDSLILRGTNDFELVYEDISGLAGITWVPEFEEYSEYFIAMEDLYIGTAESDVLYSASQGYSEFFGGGGDDVLTAENGNAWMTGDGGNDTLNGSEGDDGLHGDLRTDDFGDDVLIGNGGNDRLYGSDGNDTLSGGSGDDSIYGGNGNDLLDDGVGTDYLDGGDGVDTFQTNLSLDYGDYSFTTVVDLEAGKFYAVGYENYSDTFVSIENVDLTGNFNDNILGNAANNTLKGNNGNDSLEGRGGNDALDGGAGNDTLSGGTGTDTLIGGLGNDIYVTDGGDTITEASNGGTDTVQSSVTHTLALNVENLTLTGSAAINGTGNTLNNVIMGNSAVNTLNGGTGTDTLVGGAGNDNLTGGSGNDTFVFNTVTESGTTATASDVITDFVIGQDKINLSVIDAFASSGTNDTFVWKGTAAFSSTTQGEVRYQKFDNSGTSNDYTMVWIDNDADTAVEMAIRLTGLYSLTASDFVL